jgi:hypothetical protein
MILVDSKELLDAILDITSDMEEEDEIFAAACKLLSDHFDVPIEDVEWRDFRKYYSDDWQLNPPGRFFVKDEPVKLVWCPTFCNWEDENEEHI